MKIYTQWLRDFIDLKPPLENIADRLTMAGLEVKKIEPAADRKEFLWEVEITTNRPDWLSHYGVAREIAAVENLSLKAPLIDPAANRPLPTGWKIDVKELEGCPYYTGVYIEGLTNQQTPDFIKDRLLACGIRSISLVVDITNYVLLETGQPLHAFDADLIKGQQIIVRHAKASEKFTAINGTEYALESQDIVIADAERSVALAGVMGGKDSEVSDRTRNIFLESAYFHPRWIRMTSRRHSLASDSSYRFERRVDPEFVDFARERALTLIRQYGKPRFISGVLKIGQKPKLEKERVHLNPSEVEKILGHAIKGSTVASLLTRLGLEVKQEAQSSLNVGIPSYRIDLTRPVDLVEEVARLYGFDNIPEILPSMVPIEQKPNARQKVEEFAQTFFPGAGFFETVTFSLVTGQGLDPEKDLKAAVPIKNPLNQELGWMRPVLLPSLLNVVQKNLNVGEKSVQIFEIANRYRLGSKGPHPEEEKVAALALSGLYREKLWADPEREMSFFDLKGSVQQFLEGCGIEKCAWKKSSKPYFRSAVSESISAGGMELGAAGEVHPKLLREWGLKSKVFYAELSLEAVSSLAKWLRPLAEIPRFPSIERDLSLLVPESTKAGLIEEEIYQRGKGLIAHVRLFDLFQGGRIPKGHKNLAFRVVYQSLDRTLVSDEIQKLHTDIASEIVKKFQAAFQ